MAMPESVAVVQVIFSIALVVLVVAIPSFTAIVFDFVVAVECPVSL